MKKLSKEQQKIIYISLGSIVFLLLFLFLVYLPQSRKLSLIKQSLSSTERQIVEITNITQGRDLFEVVSKLTKDLNVMALKLPIRQEVVMNYLSDNARKYGVDVKNIVLGEKRPIDDKIPGYSIAVMPISMVVVADFRSLGNYLNSLTNDYSLLIVLERVEIKGDGQGRTNLDANLKINAYFSSEDK